MLSSLWVMSALCALTLSAPTLTYSTQSTEPQAEVEQLSQYFQLLASKVQTGKGTGQAPSCNPGNAVMPVAC
jgi:hypothetical protein